MKVQVLETFECSGHISPNSCHFWNNGSVFLQILHQSSRSWDITHLYFLAKNSYTLRNLSKWKFAEILREQSNLLMGLFSPNFCAEEICLMALNSDPKFKEKLTFCLKNDMRNLMYFNLSSENLKICTLMGYFCQKYVTFELK